MSRYENIIHELEEEYGMELDAGFDPGVNGPCDGESCRHSECECWDNFRAVVREELEKAKSVADPFYGILRQACVIGGWK